jgi:hypothetical protein
MTALLWWWKMTDRQSSTSAPGLLRSRTFGSVALVAFCAFTALGCDQEVQIDRKPVHGRIVDGEGRNGLVTFIPIETAIGPAVIGSFEDGVYRFTEGDGPVPGEYEVSIEFEESASTTAARQNGRSDGLIHRSAADVGEADLEAAKMTMASVPAEGPFEIDLHPIESASP